MSIRIDISDVADPRLGDFRDLKRADRRPDRPGGRGLVIAEGTIVVRRMIASVYPLRALLGVARRYNGLRGDLAGCPVPFYLADAEAMAEVVGFHLNRGVLATAGRLAVVLGSEGRGLSEESLAAADTLARIPMASGVDSLNVATAGAIAFAALTPPAGC